MRQITLSFAVQILGENMMLIFSKNHFFLTIAQHVCNMNDNPKNNILMLENIRQK